MNMFSFMNNFSIKGKLILIVLITCGISLVVATGGFVAKEASSLFREQRDEMESLAKIIGNNVSSAILFDDQTSAIDTIAPLRIRRNILAAYVLDGQDRVFARYVATGQDRRFSSLEHLLADAKSVNRRITIQKLADDNGKIFSLRDLSSLVLAIHDDHKRIGTLILFADNRLLFGKLLTTLGTAFLITIGSFGLAWLISSRLQKTISYPIVQLARTMQKVSDTKDYSIRVNKDSNDEIGNLITGFNQMLEEIEDRNLVLLQRQEHLHQLAHFDSLTHLPNRSLFYDRLSQALNYCKRNNKVLSVMFIDLDHFKDINDTYGHRCGDLLLTLVSSRLSGVVRDCDTLARLGGDEFTLFVQDIGNRSNASVVAQTIYALFEVPFSLEGKDIFVSCSIGITLFPDDGEKVDDLLMYADIAMYFAKEAGKNTFRFYEPEMNQASGERLSLQTDLHHALTRREFLLHYQPKLDIQSNEITGFEALIRWQHPKRGLIAPNTFIPLAELAGIIVPISDWVLQQACCQAKILQEQGYGPFKMAVNLSASHFKRHTVVASVQHALEFSGLDPAYLELELTESILIQNTQSTLDTLQELKGLGVSLAIDDFGTGYSSLSYLHRFPIDTLKIDRSFIIRMDDCEEDLAIVTAIISMGLSLKMHVIAEGVETDKQLALLRDKGCHAIQGYLFSKPLSADDILPLLCQLTNCKGTP
jgi:diguanylate cyclase (GGDEF)-like protein